MSAALERLGEDAASCVACGLCVPQCPTWEVTRNEANSPRGRVMLMASLARTGSLDASGASFLDACLGCGRCEDVCPSKVPYMRMLHAAKAEARPRQPLAAQLVQLLANLPGRNLAMRAAQAAARLGGGRLLARAPTLARAPIAPGPAAADEGVTLFTGCFGGSLDAEAQHAARALLAAGGVKVATADVACCGAIAAHAGAARESRRSLGRIRAHLAETGAKVVLATASGCALELARGLGPALRVEEAGAYISARLLARLRFRDAGGARFLVHTPCTARRLPGGGAWALELLGAIPGAKVGVAAGNDGCCGAGGLSFLAHRRTAAKLAEAKLAANAAAEATSWVSANYGCRMHLQGAANATGRELGVFDPLVVAASFLAS